MKTIDLETRYSAHNYEPLPVVLARGQGAHLWDTAGRRYVDMMSAYSAASHGHASRMRTGVSGFWRVAGSLTGERLCSL